MRLFHSGLRASLLLVLASPGWAWAGQEDSLYRAATPHGPIPARSASPQDGPGRQSPLSATSSTPAITARQAGRGGIAPAGGVQAKGVWTRGARAGTMQARDVQAKGVDAKGVEYLSTHATAELAQRGGGLIRPQHGTQAISEIGRSFMDVQAPTSSAFQLVSTLPGANVATSDPFGISPSTDISIRGMGGDAIGYVLEGMPMNDIASYGGSPGQFADTENYSQIGLQQGSADLDSPVINAAGGLMKLSFLDPSLKPGGLASFSYGNYNARRGFIRFETGEIAHSGVRGFASYSNTHADNWRGAGEDERQHVDFKFLKEWGSGSRASLLGTWNKAITSNYPRIKMKDWLKSGTQARALSNSYDPSSTDAAQSYWKLQRQPEETLYVGAPVHLRFNQRFSFDITPYAQSAYGNWPSAAGELSAPYYYGTQQVSLPDLQPGQTVRGDYTQRSYRSGVNMAFHARYKWNEFTFGYWYDYSDDNEQSPLTVVNSDGSAASIWADKKRDLLHMSNGNPYLYSAYHTMTQTNALFINDHISLMGDRLAMDVGFREVMLHRWGTNDVPGPQRNVSSNSATPLPRFGLRWNFTRQDQLFLNVNTNFRAPDVTSYYSSYYGPDVSSIGTGRLKNEYSIAEEFGYRRTGDWITASLTFFNYNFTNRQIATTLPGNSYVSTTVNAGGQTSRGVDAEIGLRPWHHISPYASFEYLHTSIDNNMANGDDTLPTKGKVAVRSPHFQVGAGLRYDDGHVFSMVTMHYMSHQYSTFMNDERMPSIVTADLAVGYRFNDAWRLKQPTIRINLSNISNQRYLSGVSAVQLSRQVAAPRYYMGAPFAALASLSTGF